MAFEGTDFSFVGSDYEAPMSLQDLQTTINWYVEQSEDDNSKTPAALLGCPGLSPLFSTQTGPVRGCWVLPGGASALVVTGNKLYLVTQTGSTFNAVAQGTLSTSSGTVSIRDMGTQVSGLGGYAIIVDGTFGYWWRFPTTSATLTFTAALTNGSPTMTFTGSVPFGMIMVAGATLTDTGGVIPGGSNIIAVSTSLLTATMSANATGNSPTDSVTLTIPTFGQIIDPGFLAADRVAFIEGFLVLNWTGTRTFYTNGPVAYQPFFPPSFFALKDSSTDNLVSLIENQRELWLVGERTSEVWVGPNTANFYFQRLEGVGPQIGCGAKHSLTRIGNNLIWLAKNEQGENFVVLQEGYQYKRVSNHAIEHALASYGTVSDAIGIAYQEEGHFFYMLVLPTADKTWVFDAKTEKWHQRLSYDPAFASYHRHRANCYMDFLDFRMVGDYLTGQVHQMSRQFFTDNGAPIVCQRRSKHVWSDSNRGRIFMSELQIEFTPGVGLQTGQGSQPTAMLRISRDGGFTWSYQATSSIGVVGATKNRCIFRLLGFADRDTVFELTYSDPTQRDIVGATLWYERQAA